VQIIDEIEKYILKESEKPKNQGMRTPAKILAGSSRLTGSTSDINSQQAC